MPPPELLPLLIALLLLLLGALLGASEPAVLSLRLTRTGSPRVSGLDWLERRLRPDAERYRFAARVGWILSALALGWIGIPACARLLALPLAGWGVEDRALRSVAYTGALLLVAGCQLAATLAARAWALRQPRMVVLVAAPLLQSLALALSPAGWPLQLTRQALQRRRDSNPAHGGQAAARAPLSGNLAGEEGQSIALRHLMAHTLELDELEIADLMRPWREVVALHDDDGHAEVLRIIRRHRYSRYPLLAAEDGEVLGVVHVKDVLLESSGPEFARRLRALAREPARVRVDSSVLALSKRFRLGGTHFALVHDLDDQLSGFLTLEDIFETVFGEITDEHERLREQQVDRRVIRLRDGSLLVRGDTPLYRLERELGYGLPEAQMSSTVGGLIMALLDRVPQEGDTVPVSDRMLSVRRCEGPRVLLAKLSPPSTGATLP